MKRILSLVTLFVILVSVVPKAIASENNFSDINETDWYYQTVMNMVESGLVDGYSDGTFKPNQSISRIEFAKIAYEALPMDEPIYEVTDEVKEAYRESVDNFWGCEIILEAAERGLGWFGQDPDDWNMPITRDEMASVVFDACVTTSVNVGLSYYFDVLTAFGDYGDCLASDYCTSILYMCSTGIFAGVNDNRDFAPNNTATRAEACTVISRVLNKDLRYAPATYTIKYDDAPLCTSYIMQSMGQSQKNYEEEPVDYSYLPSTAKGTSYTDEVYGGMTAQQAAECEEVVNNFLTRYIRSDMSELRKACIAAEYIMANCNYVYEDDAQSFYTAWGALVGGQASCWGFSYAYKLLCDAMDIGCVVVPADENSPKPHQWNEVKIDDYWYVIDVQACDLARDYAISYGTDFYFGQSDPHFLVSGDTYYATTMIEGGYTWDESSFPICNYDYFED